jgi:hypothetical protein
MNSKYRNSDLKNIVIGKVMYSYCKL